MYKINITDTASSYLRQSALYIAVKLNNKTNAENLLLDFFIHAETGCQYLNQIISKLLSTNKVDFFVLITVQIMLNFRSIITFHGCWSVIYAG